MASISHNENSFITTPKKMDITNGENTRKPFMDLSNQIAQDTLTSGSAAKESDLSSVEGSDSRRSSGVGGGITTSGSRSSRTSVTLDSTDDFESADEELAEVSVSYLSEELNRLQVATPKQRLSNKKFKFPYSPLEKDVLLTPVASEPLKTKKTPELCKLEVEKTTPKAPSPLDKVTIRKNSPLAEKYLQEPPSEQLEEFLASNSVDFTLRLEDDEQFENEQTNGTSELEDIGVPVVDSPTGDESRRRKSTSYFVHARKSRPNSSDRRFSHPKDFCGSPIQSEPENNENEDNSQVNASELRDQDAIEPANVISTNGSIHDSCQESSFSADVKEVNSGFKHLNDSKRETNVTEISAPSIILPEANTQECQPCSDENHTSSITSDSATLQVEAMETSDVFNSSLGTPLQSEEVESPKISITDSHTESDNAVLSSAKAIDEYNLGGIDASKSDDALVHGSNCKSSNEDQITPIADNKNLEPIFCSTEHLTSSIPSGSEAVEIFETLEKPSEIDSNLGRALQSVDEVETCKISATNPTSLPENALLPEALKDESGSDLLNVSLVTEIAALEKAAPSPLQSATSELPPSILMNPAALEDTAAVTSESLENTSEIDSSLEITSKTVEEVESCQTSNIDCLTDVDKAISTPFEPTTCSSEDLSSSIPSNSAADSSNQVGINLSETSPISENVLEEHEALKDDSSSISLNMSLVTEVPTSPKDFPSPLQSDPSEALKDDSSSISHNMSLVTEVPTSPKDFPSPLQSDSSESPSIPANTAAATLQIEVVGTPKILDQSAEIDSSIGRSFQGEEEIKSIKICNNPNTESENVVLLSAELVNEDVMSKSDDVHGHAKNDSNCEPSSNDQITDIALSKGMEENTNSAQIEPVISTTENHSSISSDAAGEQVKAADTSSPMSVNLSETLTNSEKVQEPEAQQDNSSSILPVNSQMADISGAPEAALSSLPSESSVNQVSPAALHVKTVETSESLDKSAEFDASLGKPLPSANEVESCQTSTFNPTTELANIALSPAKLIYVDNLGFTNDVSEPMKIDSEGQEEPEALKGNSVCIPPDVSPVSEIAESPKTILPPESAELSKTLEIVGSAELSKTLEKVDSSQNVEDTILPSDELSKTLEIAGSAELSKTLEIVDSPRNMAQNILPQTLEIVNSPQNVAHTILPPAELSKTLTIVDSPQNVAQNILPQTLEIVNSSQNVAHTILPQTLEIVNSPQNVAHTVLPPAELSKTLTIVDSPQNVAHTILPPAELSKTLTIVDSPQNVAQNILPQTLEIVNFPQNVAHTILPPAELSKTLTIVDSPQNVTHTILPPAELSKTLTIVDSPHNVTHTILPPAELSKTSTIVDSPQNVTLTILPPAELPKTMERIDSVHVEYKTGTLPHNSHPESITSGDKSVPLPSKVQSTEMPKKNYSPLNITTFKDLDRSIDTQLSNIMSSLQLSNKTLNKTNVDQRLPTETITSADLFKRCMTPQKPIEQVSISPFAKMTTMETVLKTDDLLSGEDMVVSPGMLKSYKDVSSLLETCSKQEKELGAGDGELPLNARVNALKISEEIRRASRNWLSNPTGEPRMQSSLSGDINTSEAGPVTAGEDLIPDGFQNATDFDFEYLSSLGGKGALSAKLARQSLFVKFDPIVGKLVSTPSRTPVKIMEENRSTSDESQLNSTRGNDSAELTPKTGVKTAASKPSSGGHTPSLRQEISKLQDLMIQQEQAHQEKADLVEELRKRIAELEASERPVSNDLDVTLAVQEELARVKEELAESRNSNKQLVQVMEEYEKTISQLVTMKEETKAAFEQEKEAIAGERDTAMRHLTNLEVAFNDIHQKYERAKGVIETQVANEAELKKCFESAKETIESQKQAYQKFKQHAAEKLQSSNAELDNMRKEFNAEMAKMKAIAKKNELKVKSLEESLEQKRKELLEMTQICDELIGKVSGKQ